MLEDLAVMSEDPPVILEDSGLARHCPNDRDANRSDVSEDPAHGDFAAR